METSRAETGSSQITSFGLQRQGPGHADPLPLAARELGRKPVVVLGIEPDQLHHFLDPTFAFLAPAHVVDGKRVADDGADPALRVEGAVRVLEDHLHLPPDRAELARLQPGDVLTLETQPVPEVRSWRRAMQRANVDLPQPVSPTNPRVSPRRTSRLTRSTACTTSWLRRSPED